jgi:hypothetical protein
MPTAVLEDFMSAPWRLWALCSEMWRHVVCYMFSDDSESRTLYHPQCRRLQICFTRL